jgi:hypothetical protein
MSSRTLFVRYELGIKCIEKQHIPLSIRQVKVDKSVTNVSPMEILPIGKEHAHTVVCAHTRLCVLGRVKRVLEFMQK